MYPGGQLIVNGLASGCVIAVLAVAFQMVYLPTRVFFIALAGIYSLAPFLVDSCIAVGFATPFAVLLSVSCCVLVSLLTELGSHRRLAASDASSIAHLVASLSHYIIIIQIIVLTWGTNPRSLRTGLDSVTRFGSVVITGSQWLMFVTVAVSLGCLFLFLQKSRIGLRLRALAANPTQFGLYGNSLTSHRLLSFGLGGLFAAIASILAANDIGFGPYSGLQPFLLGVVAGIIVGQHSLIGPLLGGLLLGLTRAQVGYMWSSRWQDAVTFAILGLVLLISPRGLLGRPSRLEAQG